MASAAPDSSRRFELRFTATRDGFARAFEELRQGLDGLPLDPRARFSVELIFEELVANVVRHGTQPAGNTTVSVTVALERDCLRLTFVDDGLAFDPRGHPEPPPARDLEHASIGGRGLMLVRSVSTSLQYERTPKGQNRLTIGVAIDPTSSPG
jgi:anti-sigma regulatory factor (Ser/Thr protein kinase)